MDHNNSSYEWNYQDSMLNQIGKNQDPESNTIKCRITDLTREKTNKIK